MMKTMKNKITMLFAAVLFVLVLTPAVKAEAYGVDQTAASASSATITWDAATSSNYLKWTVYLNGSYLTELPISQTSYTITGLTQGTAYSVEVGYIYKSSSGQKEYSNGTGVIRTKPSKISTTAVDWNKSDSVEVYVVDPDMFTSNGYNYKYADGFVFKIKDVKGKVKKTFSNVYNYGYGREYFKAPSALKNKGMQYTVQAYIELDNGAKVYGDAVTKVAIPQPKIKKMQSVGKNKVKVTWSKISGAKKYTIYRTTNSGKSFKKVKTVSSKTTSCTVSGIKKGSKYGVLVIANNVKVGKKKYNSTRSYYMYRY